MTLLFDHLCCSVLVIKVYTYIDAYHLYREKLKIEPNAVDQLVEATRNDVRQIINILSTYRLSQDQMSFDQAKTVYVLCGILTVFVLGNYRL